jgi:hypothetical protein
MSSTCLEQMLAYILRLHYSTVNGANKVKERNLLNKIYRVAERIILYAGRINLKSRSICCSFQTL